jgi:hypothetical protein
MNREMVQADLWGNATVSIRCILRIDQKDRDHLGEEWIRLTDFQDLSLLVDLKYEDLQKLQAVGAKAQAEQAKFILRNDLPKVWDTLKAMKGGRVDFVLDNGKHTIRWRDAPAVSLTSSRVRGMYIVTSSSLIKWPTTLTE